MSGACFQYLNGRLVQTWTSRIVADRARPDHLDAAAEAGVGRPLVAHLGADDLLSAAVSRINRASQTECVSGFWQ